MGKGFKGGNLKAIRERCLDCVGHHPGDVRTCDGKITEMDCPLHQYRFGRRPTREEIAAELQKPARTGLLADPDHEDEEFFNEEE